MIREVLVVFYRVFAQVQLFSCHYKIVKNHVSVIKERTGYGFLVAAYGLRESLILHVEAPNVEKDRSDCSLVSHITVQSQGFCIVYQSNRIVLPFGQVNINVLMRKNKT